MVTKVQSLTGLAAVSLLMAGVCASAPAQAQQRSDQNELRDAAAQGQLIPLPRLVAMVKSRPPYSQMEYLGGPEIDPQSMTYRLKFMDGRKVVVVLVDARTGRVLSGR